MRSLPLGRAQARGGRQKKTQPHDAKTRLTLTNFVGGSVGEPSATLQRASGFSGTYFAEFGRGNTPLSRATSAPSIGTAPASAPLSDGNSAFRDTVRRHNPGDGPYKFQRKAGEDAGVVVATTRPNSRLPNTSVDRSGCPE